VLLAREPLLLRQRQRSRRPLGGPPRCHGSRPRYREPGGGAASAFRTACR
jgi:hypothetical protein